MYILYYFNMHYVYIHIYIKFQNDKVLLMYQSVFFLPTFLSSLPPSLFLLSCKIKKR